MAINVAAELMQAGDEMRAALARIGDVYRELNSLPASALTEQAIVDALRADPGMAGRVIAKIANGTSFNDRREMGHSARDWAMGHEHSSLAPVALANLAVALAAASYRG